MNPETPPQLDFQNGALRISTNLSQMRLRWRPTPLAEMSLPGKSWHPFWPELRLVRPVWPDHARAPQHSALPQDSARAEARGKEAFERFRDELPEHLVRVVEPFGSHQWPLLMLLHEQPRAVDLARSNPVLAYCLANNDQFRGTRCEAAAIEALGHSQQRQRMILKWLGFPGTECMVRIMRKILPAGVSPSLLRRLRPALQSDPGVAELLSHRTRISAGLIMLLIPERLRPLITPRLLMEVERAGDADRAAEAGDSVLSSLRLIKEFAPRRRIRPFTSLAQISTFRQQVDEEYQAHLRRQDEARQEAQRIARQEDHRRREQARIRRRREGERRAAIAARPYPSPPVPGTPDIVPLTSVEQLRAEGKELCNCVGSYASLVLKGGLYVYRVMAPERATLAIKRRPDGSWRRSELKKQANRDVRQSTKSFVDGWLRRYALADYTGLKRM